MQSNRLNDPISSSGSRTTKLIDMKMSIPQLTRIQMRTVYNFKHENEALNITELNKITNLSSDSEPEVEDGLSKKWFRGSKIQSAHRAATGLFRAVEAILCSSGLI